MTQNTNASNYMQLVQFHVIQLRLCINNAYKHARMS